jgi:phosphoribosylformimino-5-aminoimidazole carboxamide ribotide isomerase
MMDGQVVRLTRGDENTVTKYESFGTPLEVAKFWCSQGADFLHVIDLDAALGKGSNRELVKLILCYLDAPIQIGGGIRSLESARDLLESRADRIILGSMAMTAPNQTSILLEEYGVNRLVIALDHRQGYVLWKGWKESTGRKLETLLNDFITMGFEWFLVTNADRDGTMKGPDIDTYSKISEKASIIASGGVRSLKDLAQLRDSGVKASIIGKALYEQRFTLPEARSYLEAL